MNDVVDIYMPDFKHWDEKLSAQYLKQKDSNISSDHWTTGRQKTYQNYLPLFQETTSMKTLFIADYLTADTIENRNSIWPRKKSRILGTNAKIACRQNAAPTSLWKWTNPKIARITKLCYGK
jgi:sulfur relay (sulfurtransferase) DsrC/TusE family protein